MKQMECKPIPSQLIDRAASGGKLTMIGFPALPGASANTVTVEEGTIKDNTSTGFTAVLPVYPGNSGSPLIKNNKLIGILSFQAGINNNIDAALHPYQKANAATATNAAFILPLIKQLQANEKRPGLSK